MDSEFHATAPLGTTIRLGPWDIDGVARIVSGPAGVQRLEPKPLSLLLVLAARPGEVIPRQDLLEAGWGEEMATDDVLSRAISELRRALGDDPRQPKFVETIRGKGYRLVVPTEIAVAAATDPIAKPTKRRVPRSVWLSIAVGVCVAGIAIFFISVRDRARIVTTDAHLAPLTSLPGETTAPRVSFDGTRIAFIRSDSTQRLAQVFVEAIDGSSRVGVATATPRALAWSPDGSRLAFVTAGSDRRAIAVVSSLGGIPRVLLDVGSSPILGIDWSPDGSRIAYAWHPAPFTTFQINLVSTDSLSSRTLTTGDQAAVGDAYPSFSPDGQLIAFARFATETWGDVYVRRVDTGVETRLTSDERNITALTFTPDGRSVTFASDRDGGSAVWRVPIVRGSPERIVASDRRITGLTYDRADHSLVVAAAEYQQHLWTMQVDGSTHQSMLMASTRVDGLPAFSPDDRHVAFLSERSGASEVWLARSNGDSAVQVTHVGGFANTPSWSPDGKRIAIERRAGTSSELWIVDVERRIAQKMAATLRDPIGPVWSRDGTALLVGSRESGDWEIWRMPLDGSRATRLTTSGGLHANESRDGKSIIFTKPATAGLWIHDLATGQERLLVESVLAGDCTNWSIGHDRVFFVDRDSTGAQRIVTVPFANGRAGVLVSNVVVPMGTGGLALSHDERRIVFGQLDRREGNLYRVKPD